MLRQLLFDLDETLYSPQTGLWPVIGERIVSYIHERLAVPWEEARALRFRYAQQYGVTLAGLLRERQVDPDDYLEYVHRLPLDQYLAPDPALNAMLARLPLPKAVLTNASADHARRVLEQLGVARHFDQIIDIKALNYINKPQPEAYRRALTLLGASGPECVFIDDLARNLAAAHDLGLITVWVHPPADGADPGALPSGVDYQTPNVLGVERVLAGLIGQTA